MKSLTLISNLIFASIVFGFYVALAMDMIKVQKINPDKASNNYTNSAVLKWEE